MNFVTATPEHMTLQIQLQISDLNHTNNEPDMQLVAQAA